MNIFELRKRTQQQIMGGDWDVPFALQDWLEKNGFELAGSGYFSKVYRQPGSNKIVKVMGTKNPSVTKCGIAFAQFQRRTNNKHFPKVYAIKTYKSAGYQPPRYQGSYGFRGADESPQDTRTQNWNSVPMTVIIMEDIPLPFDGNKVRWKRDKEYNMGLMSFLLSRDIISSTDVKANQQYFPENWRDRIDGPMSNVEGTRTQKEWFTKYRNDPLVSAINTIYGLVRKHECDFADFKLANTRMRNDGTIVLLDALPF
jgi:hypothetical protein